MLQSEDRVPINDLVGSGQSNNSWLKVSIQGKWDFSTRTAYSCK